jgi:hypothetical protein
MGSRANTVVLLLLSATAGGLLVAAVPPLWRSAFRHAKLCNYAQIGMALQNHHDTHKAFPSGTVPNPGLPPERRLSWYVELLPFLEQRELYQRFDRAKGWEDTANEQAIRQVVLVYLCPASPNQPVEGRPAPAHYVGIAGVGLDAAELPVTDPRSGVFGHDRQVCQKDIKDGASNTMWLVGTASQNGPWAAGGPGTVRPLVPSLAPYCGPNRPFGGIHPDVVHVGMADGSVRSLRETIRPAVFEALATIAGGEKIPALD